MGVVISTTSELAPISIASITVGFVSFAFTLGTFFKVVWVNLETVSEPAHNVHTMLNNLREELLEERASLRVLKKVKKSRRKSRQKLPERMNEVLSLELDDVTLRTMADAIKQLCRTFKQLERPFLRSGEEGIQQAQRRSSRRRGDMSASPHYEHSAYASPPYEKRPRDGRSGNAVDSDDELYWVQRVQYAPYNLRRRVYWLYHKSTAQSLFASLSRVQTRRISRQVNSMAVMLREYGDSVMHSEEQLGRIEERLNRVIGMRRLE